MTVSSVGVVVRSVISRYPLPVRAAAVLSVVFASAFGGLMVATLVLTTPARIAQQVHTAPGCAQRVHAQLFFGLLGPRGPIQESEWETFLLDEVTPRFPNGLTVLQANGHWRREGEPLQREASRVLEIIYEESPKSRRLIDEIATIYKSRFQQESVMIVRAPAFVCF